MLNWLKERQDRVRAARLLYASAVTAARQPAFYDACAVPDTAQGRFELIALHVALLQHRLQDDGSDGAHLARLLGEAFVTDMDDNMRELSFSDLAVPREVKRVAAALYDRHAALKASRTAPPEALAARLAGELAYLSTGGKVTGATAAAGRHLDVLGLARYLQAAASELSTQTGARLLEAGPRWPGTA